MLFSIACFSLLSNGIEITCDDNKCFDDPCCLVTETAINASDFVFSGPEDEIVRLFDASRNRKIEFLPTRIGEKFPNLVTYTAERCAIGEISKSNFEDIFHLRTLNLNGNRIKTIQVDTFIDLVSLKSLLLGNYFLENY